MAELSIIQKSSPNFDDRKDVSPSFIIFHYTGMQSAQEALEKLTDPKSKVSAHYTVDEDGTIYQHVQEDKRAWHAGVSYWLGVDDLNTHSIGIEIVNPGHEWGYHPFTGHQMKSLNILCKAIMARHNIGAQNILAHSDIAPSRKQDPGEYFPWHEMAQHGIGIWPDISDEDVIKSKSMGIEQALHDFGYDPRVSLRDNITAFQRHFVPEAFVKGYVGDADSLTHARLYTLLAQHWLDATHSS